MEGTVRVNRGLSLPISTKSTSLLGADTRNIAILFGLLFCSLITAVQIKPPRSSSIPSVYRLTHLLHSTIAPITWEMAVLANGRAEKTLLSIATYNLCRGSAELWIQISSTEVLNTCGFLMRGAERGVQKAGLDSQWFLEPFYYRVTRVKTFQNRKCSAPARIGQFF